MQKEEFRMQKQNRPGDSAFFIPPSAFALRFRLGLAEAGDLVAGLALAALFKEGRAFKTLEDIALAAQGGRRAETAML
jgi:hypothetical protein